MNRRKYLAALGVLGSGTAAAMGTGAFTSTSASRDVSVSVADDTNGYLGLSASPNENGEFASVDTSSGGDGEIALDFGASDGGGSGVGLNSTYNFDDVFRIENQGTQTIYVWANFSGEDLDDDDIWFYPGSDSDRELNDGSNSVVTLTTGQQVNVGVHIDTSFLSSTGDQGLTATLTADVDVPGDPGSQPSDPVGEDVAVVSKDADTGEFDSIQGAINAVDGTTVLVESGRYEESVAIDVDGLTLEAADGASPTVTQDSGTVVDVNADGVTADGLTVEAGNGTTAVNLDGVSDGAAVTLTDNTIDLTAGDADSVGINTGSGSGISETIADNTFEGLVFDTEVQEFVDDSENRVDRAGIVSLTNDNTFEPDVIGSVTNLITAVPQEDADVVSSDTEFATFLDDSVQKADDNSGASFAARVKPTESYANRLDGEGSDTVAGIRTFGGFFRIDISGVNTDNTYSHPDGPSISAAVVGGSGTVTHQNAVKERQEEVFLFVPQSTTSGEDITIALGNFEQGSSDWSNLDVESDDFVTVHIEDVST